MISSTDLYPENDQPIYVILSKHLRIERVVKCDREHIVPFPSSLSQFSKLTMLLTNDTLLNVL